MDANFPEKANEARNALQDTMWEVYHETISPKEAGEKCVKRMNDILSR